MRMKRTKKEAMKLHVEKKESVLILMGKELNYEKVKKKKKYLNLDF